MVAGVALVAAAAVKLMCGRWWNGALQMKVPLDGSALLQPSVVDLPTVTANLLKELAKAGSDPVYDKCVKKELARLKKDAKSLLHSQGLSVATLTDSFKAILSTELELLGNGHLVVTGHLQSSVCDQAEHCVLVVCWSCAGAGGSETCKPIDGEGGHRLQASKGRGRALRIASKNLKRPLWSASLVRRGMYSMVSPK